MKSPLKTCIIDDRKNNIVLLKYLLEKHPDVFEIIATADSYKKGKSILSTSSDKFDIIFFDKILDDGKTCYHLLEEVYIPDSTIIVLNSQEELTVHLKKELPSLSGRIFTYLEDHSKQGVENLIVSLKKIFATLGNINKPETLTVIEKDTGNRLSLNQTDIYHIEGSGNYSKITILNPLTKQMDTLKIKGQLQETYENLDKNVFIRTHNSHIVNIDKTHGFKKDGSGGELLLENGIIARYSANYREDILILTNKKNKYWRGM